MPFIRQLKTHCCILIIAIFPLTLSAQEFVISSTNNTGITHEPLALYQQANDLLAAGNAKEAIEIFDSIAKFYIDNEREIELPQAYFGMALALALNGHYNESITFHKKAIRTHKKFRSDEPFEITLNLGLTYQLAGKDRRAKKILGQSFHTVKSAKR